MPNTSGSSYHLQLGQRIRLARTAAGLTQYALGDLTGIYHSDVSMYETGKRATIDARLVMQMADALEVDAGWLLTGTLDACPLHHKNTHRLVNVETVPIEIEPTSAQQHSKGA